MLSENQNKCILKSLEQIKIQISNIENIVYEELLGNEISKDQIIYNPIFKYKKAIIGNYDYLSSEQLKIILQSFGMNVETVTTGLEIIEKIKTGYKCDVIFTNHVYQEGINGEELLEKLKKIKGFNIPIIIHTISDNKRNYFVDILGFDEYILKPIFASDKNKVQEIKDILQKLL